MNSGKKRKIGASRGRSRSKASRTSTCTAKRRTATVKKRIASRTEYAAVWLDNYDNDYGVYATFDTRAAALDYVTDTVFERAEWLEVDVLDSKDWKTKMTREQVRDQLGSGMDFSLVMSFKEICGMKDPDEYVTMGVREITHYEA